MKVLTNGIIGNGVLRRFKVILDYSRSRMILEPSELFALPYDYDFEMTGLTIVAGGREFKIDAVIKGSMADIAGLQAGDVVVAVDQRQASQMNLTQLRQIFKQDGSEHLLDVKRGEKTLVIKLKMLQIQ
jgi:C-terminal processing protease CtpA/Prc